MDILEEDPALQDVGSNGNDETPGRKCRRKSNHQRRKQAQNKRDIQVIDLEAETQPSTEAQLVPSEPRPHTTPGPKDPNSSHHTNTTDLAVRPVTTHPNYQTRLHSRSPSPDREGAVVVGGGEEEGDMPGKENRRPESSLSRRTGSSPTRSRPDSTTSFRPKTTGNRVPSTRPQLNTTKRTISRTSRKSRPQSVAAFREHEKESESENESETTHTRTALSDILDFGVDIFADAGWDTDLEAEAEDEVNLAFDGSLRNVYLESCKQQQVIPVSYFLRHMEDSSLAMKHHGLGPDGIKPIAIALVSNTTITKLNLADNWLGTVGGNHVSEMLKENCYITDINLSDNKLNVDFANKFVEVLKHNNTLTHITLSGNDLDDQAAIPIAEAMMNTTRVEYLNLSHNRFGEQSGLILGPAISENSSIKHLDLSWNSLSRKGAIAVANGIKNNVLMAKVNLSWNGFGKEGAKAIGEALKMNSSLEELDLGNNRITTEGAVLLGKGLTVNETLKVVKMARNPMQSAGCYAICASILKNPNCIIELFDFSDILVNADFRELLNVKVKELLPNVKVKTGGDRIPYKPKARVHPMVKLKNYIERNNLRLVDFFNKFDKDNSMSVTREEFAEGITAVGMDFNPEEMTILLDDLDEDGDGEISLSELVLGHQDFTEKEKKMATTIFNIGGPRPSGNDSSNVWKHSGTG